VNRTAFYAAIKPEFGGKLSQRQVDGMNAILDAAKGLPMHYQAHVLAHVKRETGGGMYPIKETVMPHHKDQNPSDAEVIRRLDVAFAKGQLKGVKSPYWRLGAFGRAQIQITHDKNYAKFGIKNYADALKLDVSARIAVEGMSKGMFTGRKLSDYDFPSALDAPPDKNPRRIVNGKDGSDAEVAKSHRQFYEALKAADVEPYFADPGFALKPIAVSPWPDTGTKGLWASLWTALMGIIKGR
jgi:hypothetical protein